MNNTHALQHADQLRITLTQPYHVDVITKLTLELLVRIDLIQTVLLVKQLE